MGTGTVPAYRCAYVRYRTYVPYATSHEAGGGTVRTYSTGTVVRTYRYGTDCEPYRAGVYYTVLRYRTVPVVPVLEIDTYV